jgi:hypothetical protein
VNNSKVCGFEFIATSQKTIPANRDAKHIKIQVTHWAILSVFSEFSVKARTPEMIAPNSGRRTRKISITDFV